MEDMSSEREQIPKPHLLIKKAFQRKQEKNPAYSQRSLARDLEVSAVFVTKILSGEKEIPPQRIKRLVKVLDLDITSETLLYKAMLYYAVPIPEARALLLQGTQTLKPSKMADYRLESDTKFSLLSKWYNVALMDLLSCDVEHSERNMAKVLGITVREVEEALQGLSQAGLIERRDGLWKKVAARAFFPTSKVKSEVRDFHRQMIKKAYEELSKTSQADFDRRLITGFTVATNPAHLPQAKQLIFDSLSEVSDVLSQGPCEEVYQYNIQLFPLSNKK